MRRVRWKKGYATGNRQLDVRNKALEGIIQEIDGALRAKEHCQDMKDLQATLTDMTEEVTQLVLRHNYHGLRLFLTKLI